MGRARRKRTSGFFGAERMALPRHLLADLPGRRLIPGSLIAERRKTAAKALRAVRKTAKPASNKTTPEQKLVQRATAGMTVVELAEVAELGYKQFLDRQLHPDTIDDGGFEDALNESLPTLTMTPFELYSSRDPFRGVIELIVAKLLRSVYSPRQLYERTVDFWSDHFSIDILANHGFLLKPVDDREVARRHAFGDFHDLLSASAHSPAMLEYLTNDSNVRGHPNENYARELMELHTVGVDGGYTQKDVREVARCFTGWTLHSIYDETPSMGMFRFEMFNHDRRSKRVMGKKIKADGGEEDGLAVIALLAEHPRTAEFISTKLLRFFLDYEPGKKVVRRVARKFESSGGNLRSTIKTVLSKKNIKRASPKLKRPQHLVASAVRATSADINDIGFMLEALELSGHLPFAWSSPNGYPDDQNYWSGFILPRWNFAATMPDASQSGIQIDPFLLDDSLSPKRFVKRLDERLFGGGMSDETKIGIEEFLGLGKMNVKRMREAVGLAIASPEFQSY